MLRGWAEAQYLVGVRFGTVGARRHGTLVEITTFREERYPEDERKPAVSFAKDIQTDLSRRDFTINSMAVRLPGRRVRRSVRRGEGSGGEATRHPARSRDRVLGRPVAHAAGRTLRLAVRGHAGAACGRCDRDDAGAPPHRQLGADPRRARQDARRRLGRAKGWRSSSIPGSRPSSFPSCPRSSSSRTRCIGTRTCSVTRSRWSSGWSPTRCSGSRDCSTTSGSRRPARSLPTVSRSTTTRSWVPGWRSSASGSCGTRTRGGGRPEAGRAAPPLPRVRRGMDRRRRAALRPRRRPAARQAEPAHAGGLHDPRPEARRAVRAPPGRAGGADRAARGAGEPRGDAPDARRPPGDGAARPRARPGWWERRSRS